MLVSSSSSSSLIQTRFLSVSALSSLSMLRLLLLFLKKENHVPLKYPKTAIATTTTTSTIIIARLFRRRCRHVALLITTTLLLLVPSINAYTTTTTLPTTSIIYGRLLQQSSSLSLSSLLLLFPKKPIRFQSCTTNSMTYRRSSSSSSIQKTTTTTFHSYSYNFHSSPERSSLSSCYNKPHLFFTDHIKRSRYDRYRIVKQRLYQSKLSIDDEEKENNNNNKIILKQLKKERLQEFFTIVIPACIQLTAEPLAGIVDTIYLGRLGPNVLGGAGIAVSAQYAVSKLYNDPLLRTTISLVAKQDGIVKTKNKQRRTKDNDNDSEDEPLTDNDDIEKNKNDLSVAVSTAILLALIVGIVQMIVYSYGCENITKLMGIQPTNDMWNSCIGYLRIRAYGTPAATLWLVSNGIFRGLGDTSTPLKYSILFTLLNAILDPLFIFTFQWGSAGAAAGTAIAQYIALIPLLLSLHKKVSIQLFTSTQKEQLLQSLQKYIRTGIVVFARTIGKVMAYSICARNAALLGSVNAAAYNLTFQLGFATTQICEAVAVAVQTLLAREISSINTIVNDNNNNSNESTTTTSLTTTTASTTAETKQETESSTSNAIASTGTGTVPIIVQKQVVRYIINTSLYVGCGIATLLSLVTYYRKQWIVQGLSTNVQVQNACITVFPIVLVTQILKGSAYPVNGILMGGLDWIYSMISMWLSNFVCIGVLYYFKSTSITNLVSLNQLWISLAAFMGTQVIAGILRYESKTGPWKILNFHTNNNKVIPTP